MDAVKFNASVAQNLTLNGTSNIVMNYGATPGVTAFNFCTIIGSNAGYHNTQNEITAVGLNSLTGNTGQ